MNSIQRSSSVIAKFAVETFWSICAFIDIVSVSNCEDLYLRGSIYVFGVLGVVEAISPMLYPYIYISPSKGPWRNDQRSFRLLPSVGFFVSSYSQTVGFSTDIVYPRRRIA
ncbi:hypothetical protein IW262DRAFT_1387001 [Armillaria fumosa]|nr:hypothetical protein IW262DRAFT_1387001 [Armillaria fumosa]